MKHPDKIRSRINKLKQTLPELEHHLESGLKTGKSEFINGINRANLVQTEARIIELEWVLEEGGESNFDHWDNHSPNISEENLEQFKKEIAKRKTKMKMSEKIDAAIIYMEKTALHQGRDWISPTEIGYAVSNGKNHSSYGSPICKKAVELGLMQRNGKGHYRLAREGEE